MNEIKLSFFKLPIPEHISVELNSRISYFYSSTGYRSFDNHDVVAMNYKRRITK